MNSKLKTKDMVLSALLTAIGILIPMIFTGPPFRIIAGPYTATLMAHVPVILALFISPAAAVFTAIGTTVGFFFTAPVVVAARAASHIFFALLGAFLIKKNFNALLVCLLTGIVHAVFEGIVVLLFFIGGTEVPSGYSIAIMTWITILGTFVHHIIDFVIAYIVARALKRTKLMNNIPKII